MSKLNVAIPVSPRSQATASPIGWYTHTHIRTHAEGGGDQKQKQETKTKTNSNCKVVSQFGLRFRLRRGGLCPTFWAYFCSSCSFPWPFPTPLLACLILPNSSALATRSAFLGLLLCFWSRFVCELLLLALCIAGGFWSCCVCCLLCQSCC